MGQFQRRVLDSVTSVLSTALPPPPLKNPAPSTPTHGVPPAGPSERPATTGTTAHVSLAIHMCVPYPCGVCPCMPYGVSPNCAACHSPTHALILRPHLHRPEVDDEAAHCPNLSGRLPTGPSTYLGNSTEFTAACHCHCFSVPHIVCICCAYMFLLLLTEIFYFLTD